MAKMIRYETVSYEVEIPKKLDSFNHWQFSSGPTTGEDFKVFARLFKKRLKSQLPIEATLVNWNCGHYYLSGFVQKDGKFAYFSISDVRGFPGAWRKAILIRTAKSDTDYTGGPNGYTNLEDFGRRINKLL